MKSWKYILVLVLLVCCIGGGIFYGMQNNFFKEVPPDGTSLDEPSLPDTVPSESVSPQSIMPKAKKEFDVNNLQGSIRKRENIGILSHIDDQRYATGDVAYYEAGTMQNGPYAGYIRIIVLQKGQVNTYSVLYTQDYESYIFVDGKDVEYSIGRMDSDVVKSSTDKTITQITSDQIPELDVFPRTIIFDDYVLVRKEVLMALGGDLELYDNINKPKKSFVQKGRKGLSQLLDYQGGIIPEHYDENGPLTYENSIALVDPTGLAYRYERVEREGR